MDQRHQWFANARFGFFMHYGLYSILARNEWILTRNQIPVPEYKKLMRRFTAEKFDADEILGRAAEWGMKYAVLTTKHHDGFCLYDSKLTDFKATNSAAKRDLVGEFVTACRKHGLKIGLYHSLNDWTTKPNSVDALERGGECYQKFIDFVHGQIRDLMSSYGKIDIMWYDGWWPFNSDGWQAEKLDAMVKGLQPGIICNNRHGGAGDYDTPEQHLTAGKRMWEGCITLNDHWCFHAGDHNWKSAKQVATMLRTVATGAGNLLLNVGPKADGSLPAEAVAILDQVGKWLKINGEAIYGSERFRIDPMLRGDARGDWHADGGYTVKGKNLYLHLTSWPGREVVIPGAEFAAIDATLLETRRKLPLRQRGGKIVISGLPENHPLAMPVVIRIRGKEAPRLYMTGGIRTPKVPHCRYDPMKPDLLY